MKKFSFLLSLFFLCSVSFASDLESRLTKARADKAVAEQLSGYLKAVSSDPAVAALVSEVNEKRKKAYEQVAKETKGATLQTVEQAAGEKLVKKYQ